MEWVDVGVNVQERLPNPGDEVLISGIEDRIVVAYLNVNCDWEVCCSDDVILPFDEITHWMPLPKSPQDKICGEGDAE